MDRPLTNYVFVEFEHVLGGWIFYWIQPTHIQPVFSSYRIWSIDLVIWFTGFINGLMDSLQLYYRDGGKLNCLLRWNPPVFFLVDLNCVFGACSRKLKMKIVYKRMITGFGKRMLAVYFNIDLGCFIIWIDSLMMQRNLKVWQCRC